MPYPDTTPVRIRAVWNMLGGESGVTRLLSGGVTIQKIAPEFERNEHGHVVCTFTARAHSGIEEIERLVAAQHAPHWTAEGCFLNAARGNYNEVHKLVENEEYRLALMPVRELSYRTSAKPATTPNVREFAREEYGYTVPPAGVIVPIRLRYSDEEIERMGFKSLVGVHESIPGPLPRSTEIGYHFFCISIAYTDGTFRAIRDAEKDTDQKLRPWNPKQVWGNDAAAIFLTS